MGIADIIVRLLFAALASIFYFIHTISETIGVISLVIAGIFILTGLPGIRPLYTLPGITNCKKKTF